MQKDRNAQFMIAEVQEVMLPYRGRDWPKQAQKVERDKYMVEEQKTLESDIKVATRNYVVQEGDTLSTISEKELGSAYRWEYLFELNKDRIRHPDKLVPGQTIIIPVE